MIPEIYGKITLLYLFNFPKHHGIVKVKSKCFMGILEL